MNKKQQKLKLEMTIFAILTFTALTVLVISEKSSSLLIPKVEKKLNTYIKDNYNDLNIIKSDVTYKSLKYTMKLTDKKNKYHYFYIYYQDKKITDTYKEDYTEGKPFIKKTEEIIIKNIHDTTNITYNISINNKLNDFTKEVQNELLETNNPERLRIYNLEKKEKIKEFNSTNIYNVIINNITSLESNKIHPRTYSFIITDNNDITKSVKIYNIKYEDTTNTNLIEIINNIINNNKLKDTNIKYKYLN